MYVPGELQMNLAFNDFRIIPTLVGATLYIRMYVHVHVLLFYVFMCSMYIRTYVFVNMCMNQCVCMSCTYVLYLRMYVHMARTYVCRAVVCLLVNHSPLSLLHLSEVDTSSVSYSKVQYSIQ